MKKEHLLTIAQIFDKKTAIALSTELIYQGATWNENTTDSAGKHSDIEFVVFIDDYLTEATRMVSRNPEPMCSEMALQNLRKIAGMIYQSSVQNEWADDVFEAFKNIKALEAQNGPKITVTETIAYIRAELNNIFKTISENPSDLDEIQSLLLAIFMLCLGAMMIYKVENREINDNAYNEIVSMFG